MAPTASMHPASSDGEGAAASERPAAGLAAAAGALQAAALQAWVIAAQLTEDEDDDVRC